MKTQFIISIGLLMTLAATAEDTNTFYATDDLSRFFGYPNEINTNSEKAEEAIKSRESLQAINFTEGNWGEPVEGLQLSLRFDKQVYTNNEPITAILLVRNTGTDSVGFPDFNNVHNYVGGGGPVGLVAITFGGQTLIPMQANPVGPGRVTVVEGEYNNVNPLRQRKFFEHLDKMYTLTNGTYLVHAVVEIPASAGKWTVVKSADVPIKIVSPPSNSK